MRYVQHIQFMILYYCSTGTCIAFSTNLILVDYISCDPHFNVCKVEPTYIGVRRNSGGMTPSSPGTNATEKVVLRQLLQSWAYIKLSVARQCFSAAILNQPARQCVYVLL